MSTGVVRPVEHHPSRCIWTVCASHPASSGPSQGVRTDQRPVTRDAASHAVGHRQLPTSLSQLPSLLLTPACPSLSLPLSPTVAHGSGCGLDAGEPHDGREPLLLDVSIAGNRSLHQTTLHEHATLGPPCPWRQHHALLVLTRAPPLTMFLAGTHRATPPPTRWCCGSPVGPAAAP